MLFESGIIQRGSGSVGGYTFSRNRGGNYIRSKVSPVNPNTGPQAIVRAQMAALTSRWVDVLSEAQRTAWNLYATNVPLPNALGDPRNVGGIAMFIRSNMQVPLATEPLQVDDAPTVFDLGEFTPIGVTSITAATGVAIITFEDTDQWLDEDDTTMLFYWSRAQNPTINYFTGPYRFNGQILGDVALPLTSPQNVTVAFAVAAGQKIFGYCRVRRADGRLSALQRISAVAI